MSLTVTFSTETGGIQDLRMQDFADDVLMDFFNQPYEEALDGTLRTNVRDLRRGFRLSYQATTQPDVFRSILNNIMQDIEDGQQFFYFGIDSSSLIRVILDEGLQHKIRYANQHGLGIPALKMIAAEYGVVDLELEFQDWRFINEAVDDARDYGLLTNAVTNQLDYGALP